MAFLVIVIRIGQIAYLAAPQPATCSSTIGPLYPGARSCRRRWLCLRRRRNTTQHPQRLLKSYTSVASSRTWGSHPRNGRQSTKTITRASNGATTSLEDGNERSTLTSASTSPTRQSRMVTSAWSEWIPRNSSPTSSRRDFMPRRGRLAFRRSSTVEPIQRKGRRSSRGGVPAERVFKSSHVGPYEGCVNETWKLAKARARHRLESPGYPSQGKSSGLGSRTQVQVVDGSTGHGNAVTTKRCGLVF